MAGRAVEAATTIATAGGRRVELAPVVARGLAVWASPYEVDPTESTWPTRSAPLGAWSGRLLGAERIDHVTAAVLAVCEDKYYADLSGTVATQRRVRVHPVVEALALDADGGLRDHADARAAGRAGLGVPDSARAGTGTPRSRRFPSSWPRSWPAPSVEAGRYDLVIDPTNLWLTIHESIGHATELDRALATKPPTPGPPSPPSTGSARSATARRS